MITHRAQKIRLYPNDTQQKILNQNFGCCRKVYNLMLEEKLIYNQKYKKEIESGKTPHEVNLILGAPSIRYNDYYDEHPYLRDADARAMNYEQVHFKEAIKNRKERGNNLRFKSKHDKQSYTTDGGVKFSDEHHFKLPKITPIRFKGRIREKFKDAKMKSVTITKNPSGKYFISILYEYDNQVPVNIPQNIIGLDYSQIALFVDSNGNQAEYLKYMHKYQYKLAREQRKLSLTQRNSKNHEEQRVKVANVYEKISNCRNDFLHKKSRFLADNYDIVAIEDIKVSEMIQSPPSITKTNRQKGNFRKNTADNGWYMFVKMLEYKLAERGRQIVKVDKFYPSTQVCSACGYQNTDLKGDVSTRQWVCPNCGTIHNRDINAAVNIRNEAISMLNLDIPKIAENNNNIRMMNRGSHGDSPLILVPVGMLSGKQPNCAVK